MTNRQKNICEWGGLFGALLSITCLIQHFIFAIPGIVTNSMIPGYLLAITAFILLALQKSVATILLILTAIYAAIIEWLWISHYAFSVVVILLLFYTVLIVVAVYTEQVPAALKKKRDQQKAEEDMWAGKI